MTNLLTRQEVEKRFGLSRSSIYRLMRLGLFPEPIRVGVRAVRWNEVDVASFLEACPRATGHGVDRANSRRRSAALDATMPSPHRPDTGYLPFLQVNETEPIRLSLPYWLSRRVKAAARVARATERRIVVQTLRAAIERPGQTREGRP